MDRSGGDKRRWVAPSLMVDAYTRLHAGESVTDLWHLYGGAVTHRTLMRWRRGESYRRIVIAQWWLRHRDRIETMQRRGCSRREILERTGYPPGYRFDTSDNAVWHSQATKLWATIQVMEMAENERWMARDAA